MANPLFRDWESLWSSLLDMVYPPRCLICTAGEESPFCAICRAGFIPLPDSICSVCGKLTTTPNCATCAPVIDSGGWFFDSARSAFRYEGSLSLAIQRLKYNRVDVLAHPLGELLGERLQTGSLWPHKTVQSFGCVIPVPLHKNRLRQRGFNQAKLLAQSVAEAIDRPLIPNALFREKRTRQQVGLTGEERRANMGEGVFQMQKTKLPPSGGILLVDDVFTTGATMNACARVIRQQTEQQIFALTLAIGV